jgi:hypothetical protein
MVPVVATGKWTVIGCVAGCLQMRVWFQQLICLDVFVLCGTAAAGQARDSGANGAFHLHQLGVGKLGWLGSLWYRSGTDMNRQVAGLWLQPAQALAGIQCRVMSLHVTGLQHIHLIGRGTRVESW